MLAALRDMDPIRQTFVFLFVASAGVLAAAWGYELIGNYRPCPLCLRQRWAYYFAVLACPVGYFLYHSLSRDIIKVILALLFLFFLLNAVVGVFHSGVEWKLWDGPAECSGAGSVGSGSGNILDEIRDIKIVICGEAPWRFLGLSFAGYNALFSAGLAGVAALGLWRRR